MVTRKLRQDKPHYVSNKEFSHAVFEYVKLCNEAEAVSDDLPIVTDYIAESFLKIAQGLVSKGNFSQYPFREEMVMDAVENCLKAINNYDIQKTTRTGKPNAFAYFTQITYFAFLRRISKEKRQLEIRTKIIETADLSNFFTESDNGDASVVEKYRNWNSKNLL